MTARSALPLCLVLALAPGCEFFSSDAAPAADAAPPVDDSDDHGGLPAPWIEVWRDDFSGPLGSGPDLAKWTVEVNPRPDNMELEYYTDRRDNTFLDGKGHLVIQALKETYLGSKQPYTSGRLDSHKRFDFTYGRVEARIRLPAGQGLWPAFWMLGSNIDLVSWPACGELDIMEEAGSHSSVVHGSAHDNYGSQTEIYALPTGNFVDRFHLFALEWTPDKLRWFLDDHAYEEHTRDEIVASGKPWTYDHPFFLLLNLAVGGFWDGTPGAATVFPAQMLVDRVVVGRLAVYDAALPSDATDAVAVSSDGANDASDEQGSER